MANFSTYTRVQLLRGLFIPERFTPPVLFKVSLTTVVPMVNAAVEELVEPMVGGYLRQDYLPGELYWEETGFGELFNVEPVVFPVVLANWGTITGWALVDPDHNECISVGELLNPFSAEIGMVPTLEAGAITIGLYEDD